MSRILKTMIVLLAIAAMVAPAMAEDRLTLGGQMRVRAWSKDFDSKRIKSVADDGTITTTKKKHTNTYADQRLRIGGKLSVAEGVSITFRTDVTESTWGTGNTYGSGRTGVQQWDRAHLDLTMGQSHFRAGQQYVSYGLASTINTQSNGLRYDYNGDINFSTFLLLVDSNGTAADNFLYGANIGNKGDNYKANLFFGYQNNSDPGVVDWNAVGGPAVLTSDDGQDAEAVYMVGVDTVYTMDAFTIKGEFNYFAGDASKDVDAFGTQLFLDVSMAASEQFTVGGQFYYAVGDDKDRQYTYLGDDFNGYDPLFDIGTSLSDEQIMVGRPFDLGTSLIGVGLGVTKEDTLDGAASTGVVGGRLYTNYKASDALNLGASFAYMTPEEDKHFKDFDSASFYAVGLTYALMANTSLHAQVEYIDVDTKAKVDSAMLSGVGLFVNF